MRRAFAGARVALILAYVLLQRASRVVARSMQNITVDDSGPDAHSGSRIDYDGHDWCTGHDCQFPNVNASQAHKGTWHGVKYSAEKHEGFNNVMPHTATATFNFTGTV